METLKLYLAGEWREGRGERFCSTNPADGSVNAWLHAASLDDVELAVNAAERAWRAPQWRQRLPHQRAAILHRVGDLITQRLEALAQLQTRDNGKPLAETRGLVASAAATAHYFAAVCEVMEGSYRRRAATTLLLSVAMSRSAWWRQSRRGTHRLPVRCRKLPRRWRQAMPWC
ncbi:aldehyde dehydrogenase family protein [Erwinia aphidicola]|uniref:aldehyde dehydrogenase family protein n=1 Tax=Erwinia aphidicola TaxID=68334 RepID=UPI0030D3B7C8